MSNFVKATKAYKNPDFLGSENARNIRILCEHMETEARLETNSLKATVLIFGSARAKSKEEYERTISKLNVDLQEA